MTATHHFFRFRSTKYLLGDKYRELEKQETYFCPLDDLNDPTEGFKDLFWRDEIVWRNLLKHYLLCLMKSFLIAMCSGPEGRTRTDQSRRTRLARHPANG
jgi:hypothetical protein